MGIDEMLCKPNQYKRFWIARNEDGRLYLYNNRPNRYKGLNGIWLGMCPMRIDSKLFPEVKWGDREPTEVELTIKIKKNETGIE